MKKILQVFKKLFSGRGRYATFYVCDPARNTKCSKEGCWYISKGPCRCTSKKKCAKLDADGKPVIATDIEITNEEWLELRLFGDNMNKN